MFNKKKIFITSLIVVLLSAFSAITIHDRNIMLSSYHLGIKELNSQNYTKALSTFEDLGDYKDSLMYLEKTKKWIRYNAAIKLLNEKNYKKAIIEFEKLGDFEKSKEYIIKAKNYIQKREIKKKRKQENNDKYKQAKNYYDAKKYKRAKEIFESLDTFKNSKQLVQKCKLNLKRLKYSKTISAGIRCSGGLGENETVYFSSDDKTLKTKVEKWKKKDIISISVNGELAIGLKSNGKVVHAGKIPGYRIETNTWSNIVSVCAGERYIIGLKSNGQLVAQGHNGDKQIDIDSWKNIIAIDAGWRHTVGLDKNGKIFMTGYKSKSQLDQIKKHKDEWTNIVEISAGGGSGGKWGINETGHTVALRADHSVVAVGDNSMGQCEVYGDDWKNIIAISAGDFHTVGLKSDHTVVTTLDKNTNSAKEIKKWTDIVAVSAGYGITLGLKSDGSVVATGYDKNHQLDIDDWEKAITYEEEWKSIFDNKN